MTQYYEVPAQNLKIPLPESGEVFRSGSTIFKRVGDTIYEYDKSVGSGFEGSFSSLPEYIIGDVDQALGKITGTESIHNDTMAKDGTFFNTSQFTPTNEIFTQTVRPDNINSAIVSSNLQGVLDAGTSIADAQARGTLSISSTDPNRIINNVTGQTASSMLPKTASDIKQVGTTQLPTTSPYFGNISSASASTSGTSTSLDIQTQQSKDIQAQQAEQLKLQNQQTKSFLDKVLSSKSPSEVRSDAMSQTGINTTQYFAEEKAKIEEIGKLTDDYNKLKAAKDIQIAATYDKLGSMNFINNQVQQIERNAAPQLNALSSEINSKAAVLQALQGRFNEAQNFINQAVEDATADQKYNLELFQTFYQINQDTINRLDTNYQNAVSTSLRLAEMEYDKAYQENKIKGELILSNPKAGISLTDTLEVAYSKFSKAGGELKTTTGTNETNTAPIDLLQQNLNSGMTPGDAARSVANYYDKQLGFPVDIKTVAKWTSEAQKLTPDATNVVEEGGWWQSVKDWWSRVTS